MVCYKSNETSPTTLGPGPVEDPVSRTTIWRDPKGPNRPENALLGVMYVGQEPDAPLLAARRARRPGRGQPLYRGTGPSRCAPGSRLAIGRELVGWEWDAEVDNGHSPPGLRLLSATPVNGDLMSDVGVMSQGDAVAHAATYRAPSGARVFATGSMLFSWGLDRMGYRIFSADGRRASPTSASSAL